MTAKTDPPAAPSREVLERASAIFAGNKSLHWDDALRAAGEQLAGEEAARAEQQARADSSAASYKRLISCGVPVPGSCAGPIDPNTALCQRHSAVFYDLEAEEAGAERLADGQTVREWVADLRRRRAGEPAA